MNARRKSALGLLAAVAWVGLAGCGAGDGAPEAAGGSAIIGGQTASDYIEAALIDIDGHRTTCTGAVIAPRIVLTAGHCTRNATDWTVTTPYAGNQRVTSTKKWTEYQGSLGGYVNPASVDVGLVILEAPIVLSAYPPVAELPVADRTLGLNVGRVRDGVSSDSELFVGRPIALLPGSQVERPLAYYSDELIQPGDSGGPVYVGEGPRRVIVAVNSGTGQGNQILARVDLVKAKIDAIIAQNGGPGPR